MSLFKFRRWWHVNPTLSPSLNSFENKKIPEEYDRQSLVIGPFLTSMDNNDKSLSSIENQIITASLNTGVLRIYSPTSSSNLPTDLIFEKFFKEPILQISLGKFQHNNALDQILAILFPKRLKFFRLKSQKSVNNLLKRISKSEKKSEIIPESENKNISEEENEENSKQLKRTEKIDQSLLTYYELEEIYEFTFNRIAFNFCSGSFGGDLRSPLKFCVQSFDGQLNFFEESRNLIISRFLPSFVVPGPMVYFKQIDSLVTYNSALKIQCFGYDSIFSGSESSFLKDDKNRKIKMSWEVTIGEEVYAIKILKFSKQLQSGQSEIFVLGERTLFTISTSGKLTSQKRLDYFPSAMASYIPSKKSVGRTKRQKKHNLIIGTHSKSLMIFNDPRLIWSAKTDSIPISIKLGKFGGKDGMIVMLNDRGGLTVGYLGTDPGTQIQKSIVPYAEVLDYVDVNRQLVRLRKKLREGVKKGKFEQKKNERIRKVNITCEIRYEENDEENSNILSLKEPSEAEAEAEAEEVEGEEEEGGVSEDFKKLSSKRIVYPVANGRGVVKITIRNIGGLEIPKIHVQLTTPPGFSVRPNANYEISNFKIRGTPHHKTLSIVTNQCEDETEEDEDNEDLCISVLRSCTVSVCYEQENGEPNILQNVFILPFRMVGRKLKKTRIFKNPIHSFVFDFDCEKLKNTPNIQNIFPDLFECSKSSEEADSSRSGDENIMTFQYFGNCYKKGIITVSSYFSETSKKYIFKTNFFPCLFPIMGEFIRRFQAKLVEENISDPVSKYLTINSIPLYEYFEAIDEHFNLRRMYYKNLQTLEDYTLEFRNIQKRCIVRTQSRNPKELGGLDSLFSETYKKLFQKTLDIQNLQTRMRFASSYLLSATKCFLLAITFKLKHLGEKDHYILKNCFLNESTQITEKLGWEEKTFGACSYLYYTIFEKRGKELRKKLSESPKMAALKNTKDLKKIITQIVEKVKKENIFVDKKK